jgi:hypothetical protein
MTRQRVPELTSTAIFLCAAPLLTGASYILPQNSVFTFILIQTEGYNIGRRQN